MLSEPFAQHPFVKTVTINIMNIIAKVVIRRVKEPAIKGAAITPEIVPKIKKSTAPKKASAKL